MPKKKFIKDLSFDHEQGHVALVGPAIGGAANLQNYSITLKAGEGFTPEILEKATKIQVTLSIEDYLSKFWGMYYPDAEALALALGFTVEASEKEQYDYAEDYRKYLDEKVGSISIMKSLKEDGVVDIMSKLNGEEYLQFLADQETIEKAFTDIELLKQANKVKVKESGTKATSQPDTQHNASVEKSVEPSGSENKPKKETMTTKEVKTVVADVEKELVEKSVLESVQKALDEQKVELTKALEMVKQFEQEKKDAITKSRKEKLTAVVKNKEQVEVLFKALNLVEGEAEYEAVVSTLAEIQKLADQSELFKSVGADGAPEVKVETGVSDIKKAVQARLAAKQVK